MQEVAIPFPSTSMSIFKHQNYYNIVFKLNQLKIVPLEIVQKAPLPIPQMRVLTDVEHHKAGDGLDIQEVQMGQPLRVEFSLQPETGNQPLI
jgi:hypothetical protein